mgnify:CR=1 FL=1
MARYLTFGANKDGNHEDIRDVYKCYNIKTKTVTTVAGFADLVVSTSLITDVVEIKLPGRLGLTKLEQVFQANWPKKVPIIATYEDAREHIASIWHRHNLLDAALKEAPQRTK